MAVTFWPATGAHALPLRYQRPITIGGDGYFYIAMPSLDNLEALRLYRSTDQGVSFSEVISNTYTATAAEAGSTVLSYVSATTDKNGNLHFTWTQYRTVTGNTWLRYGFFNIQTQQWSTAEYLWNQGNIINPDIAVDTNMGVHILTCQGSIVYHFYRANGSGSWGIVSIESQCDAPLVVANLTGGIYIVYTRQSNGLIINKTWTSGSGWSNLHSSGDTFPLQSYSIVVNHENKMLFVGTPRYQSGTFIFFIYNGTTTYEKPSTPYLPFNNNIQTLPTYFDKTQNVLHMFYTNNGQINQLTYANGSWSNETIINTFTPSSQYDYLTCAPTGNTPFIPIHGYSGNMGFYTRAQVHNKVKYRTLKINSPSGVINIPLYPAGISGLTNTNLRIKVDGNHPYCVAELGLTNHPKASPLRINTPSGVRSVLRE